MAEHYVHAGVRAGAALDDGGSWGVDCSHHGTADVSADAVTCKKQ